jgi:RND family efflux transporter MFP subunit
MLKYVCGVCAAGALAFLLLGCTETKTADVAVAAPPSVTQPATNPAPARNTTLVISGPLVVENQVDVAAMREGIVDRVMAEPGTLVKKGQLLALLDNRQLASDLEAARAKTRSVQADLRNWEAEAKVLDADRDRAQKMWDAGLITKEQYDHAKYKAESDQWDVKRVEEMLTNARASERSLELELDKTHVRAPFNGIVARRYVRAGQKVALGDRLFWVTAQSPLRVKFALPEQYLGRIKKGMQMAITSPDVQDEQHRARVIQVSPVIDPSSGTIEVLAEVASPYGELRPGMTANIQLDNQR